jgi:hypothetical protein
VGSTDFFRLRLRRILDLVGREFNAAVFRFWTSGGEFGSAWRDFGLERVLRSTHKARLWDWESGGGWGRGARATVVGRRLTGCMWARAAELRAASSTECATIESPIPATGQNGEIFRRK